MTLNTLCLELLDSHNKASPRSARSKRLLVDPSLKHVPEPALSKKAIRPEVPSGILEITECEGFEVAGLTL